MGTAAGIFVLVVVFALLIGLVLNHRTIVELRGRRDELDVRVAGVEARMAQLAELERRQNLAGRRAPQNVSRPAPPAAVRRVPPPPIAIRPSSLSDD